MDRSHSTTRLNPVILEEAAEWLIEFSSPDTDNADRQRFDTWLRQSPEHVRAYLELLPIWEDGASLPPHGDVNIDELIALGRNAEGTVVPFEGQRTAISEAASVSKKVPVGRMRLAALAASIIFAALAAGTWRYFTAGTYTTGVGEQRSLALEDGSTVNLNTRSRIRIEFTEHARNVELLEGQALFEVAKDQARPFVVSSDATRVRAVGTQFDVHRKRSGTVVTVVEGRVAVFGTSTGSGTPNAPAEQEKPGSGVSTFLSAGEQLIVTPSAVPKPTRANLAAATAWTQRRLVFDAATLADVVEEFNRYNQRTLVLNDPELEAFPITAAFSSTDPASLIRFLQTQPGIQVVATGNEIEISRTR